MRRRRPTSTSRSTASPTAREVSSRRRRREGGGRWKGNRFRMKGVARIATGIAQSRTAPTASTRTPAPERPTRMRAARCSIRCACAISTCSWPCPGQDMEDLYPLIGIVTPIDPAVPARWPVHPRITGTDTASGTTTTSHGVVGDSDLAGDASVDTGRARPFLRANLVSKRLDFDDLAGFVGKAPQAGAQRIHQCRAGSTSGAPGRRVRELLPDTPYELRQAARDGCRRALEGASHQRPKCRSTTWMRTCCWTTACCGWSR